MQHAPPVPDIPLWEQFTAECRRVIAEFGLDPDDRALFELTRSGDHQCSIVKAGEAHGWRAEFGLQLGAAHVFRDGVGGSFLAPAELQFNGRTSPLAIALQIALYPLVFDTVDRKEAAHLLGEAAALFHAALNPAAAGPIDLSQWGRR